MSFQILTAFWGDKHFDWFERGLLRSMAFPDNAATIKHAHWNVFTEYKYFNKVEELVELTLPGFKELELRSTDELRDRNDELHSALIWQFEKCLRLNEKLLLAPPDTMFGNRTISNLQKIGREKNTIVFSPHPRVLPTILDEAFFYNENSNLVSAAWKHLHKSWSDAEVGHPRQNSYVGGVHWQSLDKDLVSVSHRLPTPYFMDICADDLKFFESQIAFGVLDHTWPAEMLIKQERMRVVGGSDACFVMEITDADKNVPPIMANSNPERFWRSHLHNQINNQYRSIFRGAGND